MLLKQRGSRQALVVGGRSSTNKHSLVLSINIVIFASFLFSVVLYSALPAMSLVQF